MAGIDKIYGSREQRRELKRFIRRLRLPGNVKRRIYRCFYPPGFSALANFQCWIDRLLWKQPELPAWVRERLANQYNGAPR
jgi:hypothetical protein